MIYEELDRETIRVITAYEATVVTLFLGHDPNIKLRLRLFRLPHEFGMGEWRTDKSTFHLSGQTDLTGSVSADLWGDHLRFAYAPSTRAALSFEGHVKENTLRGKLAFADGGQIRESEWEARREPTDLTGRFTVVAGTSRSLKSP